MSWDNSSKSKEKYPFWRKQGLVKAAHSAQVPSGSSKKLKAAAQANSPGGEAGPLSVKSR